MDGVKVATLKEIKRIIKIKHKFTIYGDDHKQECNPNRCTKLVAMLDPL